MGNIGIMGGTFDPIHNGHLDLGKQAYEEYALDQIWYMPSGRPPHKKDQTVTESGMRLTMTQLATKGRDGFVCSDFEVKQKGNTYTAKTLKLLKEAYPNHAFYFIIGADSLYEIESWYQPAQVMALAVLLVAPRRYEAARRSLEEQLVYVTEKYHGDIRLLHGGEMDISSARLRHLVSQGRTISPYVPPAVDKFIRKNQLYEKEERS